MDVLDAAVAEILEIVGQLVADLLVDDLRDTDPVGLGHGFEARRDVDPVAIDVLGLGDHVAEIDADAEDDALLLGDIGVAAVHAALHRDGAQHRLDDAGEFDQHTIAGEFDDPPVMLVDLGVDELAAMRLEAFVGALLVCPHQARIAHHIGSEDRSKAAAS